MDERIEEIRNIFIELLTIEKRYETFLNIGASSKKLKMKYTIDFTATKVELEKKYYIATIIDGLINHAFKIQHENSNKTYKIKHSCDYYDRSLLEFNNCLFDIDKEIDELDYIKQQTEKIRFCFYDPNADSHFIHKYLNDIKYGYTQNYNNIKFESVPGIEGIFLTSGPIMDFNNMNIKSYNNEIDNVVVIDLEIPLGDVNFIKLEFIDNKLNFQREEKIKRIME